MYIPKSLQEENVHNNCLMGLIFWTSWGPDQQKSKTQLSHDFRKNFPKVSVSGNSLEPNGLVLHALCLSLHGASLARSVPKPHLSPPRSSTTTPYLLLCQAEGWSSLARYEVRLLQVNCE